MFTVETRQRLRTELLETAHADRRISGAAITGSAALGTEDQWSDIDLAFAIAEPGTLPEVVSHWTTLMYDTYSAVDHLDVAAGKWLYRVFLLPDTLQVDLAFAPADEFRPLAPSFKLVFGTTNAAQHDAPRPVRDLIGWGWLYALHARSALGRRKFWQAEYMISGLRDTALALACVRHQLPTAHARGVDALPHEVAARFERALVNTLDAGELGRAFRAAVDGLLDEIRQVDTDLELRLRDLLTRLTET
jgi:hypothetical protein